MSSNRKTIPVPKSSRARNRRLAKKQAVALNFETLEVRHLLATATVSNATDLTNADTSSITALIANDGGDGISLREAITASNNTSGEDTISFDPNVFSGGANSLIRLTQGKLEITEALTIDGVTATDVTITGDASGNDITLPGTFITDVVTSSNTPLNDDPITDIFADNDLLDDNSLVLDFSSQSGTLSLANLTLTGGGPLHGVGERGGIRTSSGNLSLLNSTVSGNGGIWGGGIHSESGDITLLNSLVSENSSGGHGGGVYSNSGNITLIDSTVSENSSAGLFGGGGIHTISGTVTLTNSSVSSNNARFVNFDTFTILGAGGGGIYSRVGDILLTDSTISKNSTSGARSHGGGIFAFSGSVSLTNSTVSGNSTSGDNAKGGGIGTFGGTVSLVGSTISGNSTSGGSLFDANEGLYSGARGGGIYSHAGDVSLINSTLSGNSTIGTDADGGGLFTHEGNISLVQSTVSQNIAENATGGGVMVSDFLEPSSITIENSIVADNSDNGTAPDLRSAADSALTINYSLISNTIGSGVSTTGTGNLLSQPAALGPLADNGGPTMTHALLSGSLAINAGGNALSVDDMGVSLATDQRGSSFDRIRFGIVDIGAFESNFESSTGTPIPIPTIVSTTINEGGVQARPDLWNTLTVVFNTDVDITVEALALFDDSPRGAPVDLTGVGFSYDSESNTAIWDFTTLDPLDAAFYTWQLDASSVVVGDLQLDGDVDGTVGGDFSAEHLVAIPGDANLDGVVDRLGDAFALANNLGTTTGAVWAEGDFNGDGKVTILEDAFILVRNRNQNLNFVSDVTVTNNTDLVNANTRSIFDLLVDDGGDGVSLREAVIASNNTAGIGTITFATSLSGQTITLGGTDIDITEAVTIDATALADNVTIDGNEQSRIFDITATTGDFTLAGLTLTGGRTTEDSNFPDFAHSGGAIRSLSGGTLTLDQNSISENSTSGQGSDGGGIFAIGDVTLTNSTVIGNSTSGLSAAGGGLFVDEGDVSLTNSRVSSNSTVGGTAQGGGVYVRGGNVSLTSSRVSGNSTTGTNSSGGGVFVSEGDASLTNSTVSENSTSGDFARGGGIRVSRGNVSLAGSSLGGNSTTGERADGGGIYNFYGNVSLFQSTLSGNSTTGDRADGGGIYISRGDASLTQSTVTQNIAEIAAGGGVAVATYSGSSSITIENSIVADNADSGIAPDIRWISNSPNNTRTVNFSLIGNTTSSGITETTGTGNILNQAPLLGPLADNGGPTLTHSFALASPAIDGGSNSLAVDAGGVPFTTDQRGSGFDRVIGNSVDIGAFEFRDITAGIPTVVSAKIDEGGVLARPDLWNTLTVVFNVDVDISAEALSLLDASRRGLPVDLSGIGFSYDSATNTATWDFTTIDPLDAAFYTWQLDASLVVAEGLSLDGNGDGTVGGDFSAEHLVAIQGDANLDGVVDRLGDAFALANNLGTTTGAVWADGDFNGDGKVSILEDAFILVRNRNQNLSFVSDVTVTNNTDLVNANTRSIFDLLADDGGDGISLREAVIASNNTAGIGTITFATSLSDQTITLGGTDIDITEAVTIDATALADNVTIDGNEQSRIFDITASTGDFTLAGLTLTGGRTTVDNGFSDRTRTHSGGAIRSLSSGTLTLEQTDVTGNSTAGIFSGGGGIFVKEGDVWLTNSTVSENSTSGNFASGGGIHAEDANVSLINSTVSGNSTSGALAPGGGISTGEGNVSLTNSTISGNSTLKYASAGGGIFVGKGSVSLTNTTVSGNSTLGYDATGGGVHAGGGGLSDGSVTILQSTITNNHASNASGGGVKISRGNNAEIVITGSIVTGNTSDSGMPNLDGATIAAPLTASYSLIGTDIPSPTSGNNFQSDAPLLAPLADNGGPTLTHALLPGSPAINNGSNALAVDAEGNPLTTDQRGSGFDRILSGTIDIGAFESDFASIAAANSRTTQATLAGDHDLRDDVFGNDF